MAKPQDHTVVFTGAGEREIHATGRYCRVLDAPVADIFLQFDGSGEIQRGAGAQVADPDPNGFRKIRVRSTVAQTVRISVSDAPQDDNRQAVSVNATANVEGATETANTPAVSVAAGATALLIAGDPDRLQVRICIPSDAAGPVWIGAAAVGDEEAGLFEPGVIDYIDGEMALYAHNPHATEAVLVSVMPLRRP